MSNTIRWGILGTGSIARGFVQGLAVLPDARVVAVGSRAQGSADAFGDEFGIPHRYPSYAALAESREVDVIYVATPHNLHRDNTLLCLEQGKAVLCEKPFAINASEAREMIDGARERNLFLMEAMWTRFLPRMARLRELLAQEVIGEVRMIMADLGFRADFNPSSRLFDPALGGGGLLDVGIYPLSFASMVFGAPDKIASQVHLGETGVDEQAAILLGYDGGKMAVLSCATRLQTPVQAHILGTKGRITIPSSWFVPGPLVLSIDGEEEQVIELPGLGNGFNYEAAEVMRCLQDGMVESAVMPLDETLSIMTTLDSIRAQWGLKYPMELQD